MLARRFKDTSDAIVVNQQAGLLGYPLRQNNAGISQ